MEDEEKNQEEEIKLTDEMNEELSNGKEDNEDE